ncbi:MAG: hypothetical protein VB078_00625 [Clostridiaceae bacterium]|nr:hypothetical protein [Clostridiaceae bacterium]
MAVLYSSDSGSRNRDGFTAHCKRKGRRHCSFSNRQRQRAINQNATQEALCFWELLYGITPDGGIYKDLREAISNILTSFNFVRAERDEAIADRYRKAALDAWEAEKAQYDKEARLRSEEAAEKEKERIHQNKIERYKQTTIAASIGRRTA